MASDDGGNAPRAPDRPLGAARYDENMRAAGPAGEGLAWHDPGAAPLELSGFPFFATDGRFRRLPLAPPAPLPEAVDHLANHTAGGRIRLRCDSRRVAVRVELTGPANMNHMPATGQCGFDIYVGPPGAEVFAGIAKYDHTRTQYEVLLFRQPQPVWRDLTLHFPLYQGVRRVEVGLDADAGLEVPTRLAGPGRLVFYGTSITQGGCAARPGMAYPNILARRLQAECVNEGFSGSGRGEPEVARALAAIDDVRLFVLDYDANCPDAEHLGRTLPVFVDILRAAHRRTPILVLSRIRTGAEAWDRQASARREARAAAQRAVVQERAAGGDDALFFLNGADLLDDDFHECTVDGSHPTDLGFLRLADGLEPVLRRILAAHA